MGEALKRAYQNLTWGHNLQFKIGASVLVCIGRLPMIAHQPIGVWVARIDTTFVARTRYAPKLFKWQKYLAFGGKKTAIILTPLPESELKAIYAHEMIEHGNTEYSGPPGYPGSFGEAS